jgi:hypothetical protein
MINIAVPKTGPLFFCTAGLIGRASHKSRTSLQFVKFASRLGCFKCGPHEDKLFASGPCVRGTSPLSLLVSTAQRGRGHVWWDEGKAAGSTPSLAALLSAPRGWD